MKKTSSKKPTSPRRNEDLQVDARALVRAAQRAVREALRDHKRAGNPVTGIKNGKVVLIPASRIKA
jgi:hypothetical protein